MFRILLPIIVPSVVVTGWGGDGHSIITQIASRLIDGKTHSFLVNFLGEEYIEASRWADTEEAKTKYPKSKFYHYSDTPYRNCQEFDFARDCGSTDQSRGLCLVSGLVENIRIAADPSVSRETRVDALKFVLHFVGDIHQPLHTGFQKDRGGSAIKLLIPIDTSLHEVWDNYLIERAIRGTERETWRALADEIYARVSKNDNAFLKRIVVSDKITEWSNNHGEDKEHILDFISRLATETSTATTCKHAYMDEHMRYLVTDDVISETYFTTRLPVVVIQLAKASSRLAIVLDAIAKEYSVRLSERKYLSRSIRVQEAMERMRIPDSSEESLLYFQTSNSFDPLGHSAHDFFDMSEKDDSSFVLAAVEETNLTKSITRASRRQKADSLEKGEVDWTAVAKYNEKLKSQTIIDGIDLTKINGYIVDSKFFVSYKALPRRKILKQGDSMLRAINNKPEFVYFDTRVFSEPLSAELAKRTFLKAKKFDVDTVCDTLPFEKQMGYLKGFNFTIYHTPFASRHDIEVSQHGKIIYSGEHLGYVSQEYLLARLQYTRFAYWMYTERVLRGHITNARDYRVLYNETINTLESCLTMVSYDEKIGVITLVDLWKKGDGKTPETIFPGFYYFISPGLAYGTPALKILLDLRIFPGPPPTDRSLIMRLISLARRNPIFPTGKVTGWFQGMQEYSFGKHVDRMSRYPNFGSIEMFRDLPHDKLGTAEVSILRLSTKPLAYEMKHQNELNMFGVYLSRRNWSSPRYFEIMLPTSNRTNNYQHTSGGNGSFYETQQIPFAHINGTIDTTEMKNIALPSSNTEFSISNFQVENEIREDILLPRQSIVMVTDPGSGLVVLVNGFDFILAAEIVGSISSGEFISFVACLVTGRESEVLFESDHAFVLVDERILRSQRKALSLVILRDIVMVAGYNARLARSINETVILSQFGRDLEWFVETVLYSNNSTTDSNPRWNLNSGLQLPSALGVPSLPIYQYYPHM